MDDDGDDDGDGDQVDDDDLCKLAFLDTYVGELASMEEKSSSSFLLPS